MAGKHEPLSERKTLPNPLATDPCENDPLCDRRLNHDEW